MPSPGGQVSGMAGENAGSSGSVMVRWVPSRLTSPRAITPRQGGKPGNVSRRSTRKVAPLTQRDRATPGQTGWHTRPPMGVGRGCPCRGLTEGQDLSPAITYCVRTLTCSDEDRGEKNPG